MSPGEIFQLVLWGSLGMIVLSGSMIHGAVRRASVVLCECSWCGAVIRLGTAQQLADQSGVSHGLCPSCHQRLKDTVDTLFGADKVFGAADEGV